MHTSAPPPAKVLAEHPRHQVAQYTIFPIKWHMHRRGADRLRNASKKNGGPSCQAPGGRRTSRASRSEKGDPERESHFAKTCSENRTTESRIRLASGYQAHFLMIVVRFSENKRIHSRAKTRKVDASRMRHCGGVRERGRVAAVQAVSVY